MKCIQDLPMVVIKATTKKKCFLHKLASHLIHHSKDFVSTNRVFTFQFKKQENLKSKYW